MLQLPPDRTNLSVNTHNSSVEVVADWVEGSALFCDERVARAELIDILDEANIYRNQDFANEFLDIVWAELKHRQKICIGYPFNIDTRGFEASEQWDGDCIAYSFMLFLSLRKHYRLGRDAAGYTEQGELFESLVHQSLLGLGLRSLLTGWSKDQANKIASVADLVADHIDSLVNKQGLDYYFTGHENEIGCDVVGLYGPDDGRPGMPVFLCQAASGADWDKKLSTPEIHVWKEIVMFPTDPSRAFAMPFALQDKELRRAVKKNNGMMLERFRLFGSAAQAVANDVVLRMRMGAWLGARLKLLPEANS